MKPKTTLAHVHNDSNTYILGAGFSRPAGLPLIGDFMFQMRDALDWFVQNGRTIEAAAISQVLRFRLSASSSVYRIRIDLENVEDLFSLASAGDDDLDQAMRVAIACTIGRAQAKPVRATTFTSSVNPKFFHPDGWSKSPDPNNHWDVPTYAFIVQALLGAWDRPAPPARENTFVSFNYDQILENALDELAVPYSHTVDSLDDGRHGSASGRAVKVLKLHGSVNWAIPRNRRKDIAAFMDASTVIDQGLTPQLIPPTWRKDSLNSFRQIWSEALSAITRATRWSS